MSPVAMLAGHDLALPLMAVGAIAGLMPDVDHPHSDLGRMFWFWPSVQAGDPASGFVRHGRRWFGGRVIWHRGETHSIGGALIATVATVLLAFALAPQAKVAAAAALRAGAFTGLRFALAHPGYTLLLIALAVLVGYLSHLVADLLNPSPQMWAWPLSTRMLRPRLLPSTAAATLRGRLAEATASSLAAAGLWFEVGHRLI